MAHVEDWKMLEVKCWYIDLTAQRKGDWCVNFPGKDEYLKRWFLYGFEHGPLATIEKS